MNWDFSIDPVVPLWWIAVLAGLGLILIAINAYSRLPGWPLRLLTLAILAAALDQSGDAPGRPRAAGRHRRGRDRQDARARTTATAWPRPTTPRKRSRKPSLNWATPNCGW